MISLEYTGRSADGHENFDVVKGGAVVKFLQYWEGNRKSYFQDDRQRVSFGTGNESGIVRALNLLFPHDEIEEESLDMLRRNLVGER